MIKAFFSKNLMLKAVSLIIAILLWVYVILVVDPPVELTIRNIPISYVNEASLETNGFVLVRNEQEKVTIKIKGSRKKIANFDDDSVYAEVNLGAITQEDLAAITKTGTISLPVSVSVMPYESDSIVSQDPYNIKVTVDRKVSVEKDIVVKSEGNPANGYMAGEPVLSTERVTLTGAESLISRIDEVRVTLDLNGRASEINDNEKLYFVDNDGVVIEDDDFIYRQVKMSVESVNIVCPVHELKTVNVKIPVIGSNSGFNYTWSPRRITIYAPSEVLAEISEIKTETFMITEETQEGTYTVPLVIPDEVEVFNDIDEIEVKLKKD